MFEQVALFLEDQVLGVTALRSFLVVIHELTVLFSDMLNFFEKQPLLGIEIEREV